MNGKNKSEGDFNLSDLSGVTDAVKERIYERAKSPFVSAFIIAWVAINFRTIYALITSESYSEAYRIIDLKVWSGPIETVSMVFIFPIASTFIYLAAVPLLEEIAVKLWARGKIKVRTARASVEELAALDGESIKYFTSHISLLKQENSSAISQLRSEHQNETQKIKDRLEYLRNKNCESISTQEDVRRTLHNMSEIGRDILWICNNIQAQKRNMISSRYIFDEINKMHPDISLREVNQTITYLSAECYIAQEIGDIIADVSFQLSVRGNNLAEVMIAEGIIPKFIKQMNKDDLIEVLGIKNLGA